MVASLETCQVSGPSDGWFSCWIQTTGESQDECQALAEQIMSLVAHGKHRLIRQRPWGRSSKDFETDRLVCCGGARFAFRDEAGVDEHRADASVAFLSYLPALVSG